MVEITVRDPRWVDYKDFDEMDKWAQENCESYVSYSVNDTGEYDVLGIRDTIGELIGVFEFTNEKDAAWFCLRWSQ